jgi:glutamine amidotransferase
MITIVDYGVGNLESILNILDYLGIESQLSGTPDVLRRAEKLILPGVGAFDNAMSNLCSKRLIDPLNHAVMERKAPVMGICLGMQLLTRGSEEGVESGLGWIDAEACRIKLPETSVLKVPHIGWAEIRPTRTSELFEGGLAAERFYFNHSYHVICDRQDDASAFIDYGFPVCCAVQVGNVFGVQFHPEKSHRYGMRLLRAFAET